MSPAPLSAAVVVVAAAAAAAVRVKGAEALKISLPTLNPKISRALFTLELDDTASIVTAASPPPAATTLHPSINLIKQKNLYTAAQCMS
jgi:hypothetical protein